MTHNCQSCNRITSTQSLRYDSATGLMSCRTCREAVDEVPASDNAFCTLHRRTLYVTLDTSRTPRYILYRESDNEAVGFAMTLDGVITIADQYTEMYSG